MTWYTKAVKQGHAGARVRPSRMYPRGCCGVPRNNGKAAEWCTKAPTEQGAFVLAQFLLAIGICFVARAAPAVVAPAAPAVVARAAVVAKAAVAARNAVVARAAPAVVARSTRFGVPPGLISQVANPFPIFRV